MSLAGAVVASRRLVADKVVRHTLPFGVWDGFVIVVPLRVAGDDVPGVQEAREVAQHAEQDIDQGVGRADAGFDPD